jgi:hypothetical protein
MSATRPPFGARKTNDPAGAGPKKVENPEARAYSAATRLGVTAAA